MKKIIVVLLMFLGLIISAHSENSDFEKISFYDNDGNLIRVVLYDTFESENLFSEYEIFDFLSNMCDYANEQQYRLVIKSIEIYSRNYIFDTLINMILEKYKYCYENYYKEDKFSYAILYFSLEDSNYICKITYYFWRNK